MAQRNPVHSRTGGAGLKCVGIVLAVLAPFVHRAGRAEMVLAPPKLVLVCDLNSRGVRRAGKSNCRQYSELPDAHPLAGYLGEWQTQTRPVQSLTRKVLTRAPAGRCASTVGSPVASGPLVEKGRGGTAQRKFREQNYRIVNLPG